MPTVKAARLMASLADIEADIRSREQELLGLKRRRQIVDLALDQLVRYGNQSCSQPT